MKTLRTLFIIGLLLVLIPGCNPLSSEEFDISQTPADSPSPTAQVHVSTTPIPTPTRKPPPVIITNDPLTADQGPLLLLQTGFYKYQYLNPITQTSYPFEPPTSNPQFRFRANLSPSGTQLFFPLEAGSGVIIDLRLGKVVHTYDFSSPDLFNPEQAANKARPLVTELNLSDAGLLDAVTQAHQRSRQLLRWHQSDRFHLSVKDTGEVSTSLFLDDHQTGTQRQLENLPGLVENFSVGPDGNTILLKKGLVFEPGAYQDDQYYLVSTDGESVQTLLLPEDVQNPSVTWFSENTIGVIHQAFMAGGSGFSLIDITTMESSHIFSGEFSNLRRFGEHLLVFQQDSASEITTFELITLAGEPIATQTIENACFFQYATSDQIIVQCDLVSYLLDQTLRVEPYIDFILSLSPAPNRRAIVMTNRSEQSFLLDADLHIQYELFLEETPVEILWLPDSSGFLYRTFGKLYYYDLISVSSHLLLESDIFGDYININGVWVNLE